MYISCYNLNPSLKESLNNYYTYNNKIDYLEDLNKLLEKIENGTSIQVLIVNIDTANNDFAKLISIAKQYEVPIILLSAEYDLETRERYLLMGANLVLKSPCSAIEIIYSATSICSQIDSLFIVDSNFQIDLAKREVRYKEEELILTTQLFELLVFFIKNKGKIIPRSEIIKELYPKCKEVDDRRVDTLIKQLRKRTDYSLIKTKRGCGYIYTI